jgi:hypothetical protein
LPRIDLVLSDDWELFGDGSGDMRHIQFDNLRTLARIYEDAGLRGSFNAEVMQQLYHLDAGRQHPALLELAHEWNEVLRQTFANGHDVQLHVHPQWHEARYIDGQWVLTSDWTLGNHPLPRIRQMLGECKIYLENLLKPIKPDYKCVVFRAGAWALAPSPDTLPALVEAGILVDTSIAPGMIKTGEVDVDYSQVRRALLPYYPELGDARQIAREPQPLICMPTHTFDYTPVHKIRHTLSRRGKTFSIGPLVVRMKSYVRWHTSRTTYVSDLSGLTFPLMQRMLDDIRHRTASSRAAVVPVVLTNHTKDLTDFQSIRKLATRLAAADDIHVITLTQLADNIRAGRYPVRMLGREGQAAWRSQVLPSS